MLINWKSPKGIAGRTKCRRGPRVWDPCSTSIPSWPSYHTAQRNLNGTNYSLTNALWMY